MIKTNVEDSLNSVLLELNNITKISEVYTE